MKLPAKVQIAVRSHVDTWRRDESHGVVSRATGAYKLCRYTFAGMRPRYELIGWRVFLRTKDKKIVALDIMSDGSYRFYVGNAPSGWLKRAQVVEKRRSVQGYEARILTIPAIHRTLLWFTAGRAAKPGLFEFLDRKPPGKSRWMTKREVDELVKTSIGAASRMWRVAKRPIWEINGHSEAK